MGRVARGWVGEMGDVGPGGTVAVMPDEGVLGWMHSTATS